MDIVERLRDTPCDREPFTPDHAACRCRLASEAANEIEKLRQPGIADQAVAHVLLQMKRNPELAYYLGFGTQSFDLLTEAHAKASGLDVQAFRDFFGKSLKTKAPATV